MEITINELRQMKHKEGMILQGCGGDIQEWVIGINELLTQEDILLEGTKFKNVKSFRNEGLTNLLFPFSDPSKKIILNNDNDEQRMLFESCTLKGKRICNPIVDWRDSDVWEYIRSELLEINPLYDMGFYRVGCLGCPMAGKNRWTEFRLFPTYQKAYIRSFGKMLDAIHAGGGKTKWKTAEDVFSWWMEEETIEGQMCLIDMPEWKIENKT